MFSVQSVIFVITCCLKCESKSLNTVQWQNEKDKVPKQQGMQTHPYQQNTDSQRR